jgi:hypothetical protein
MRIGWLAFICLLGAVQDRAPLPDAAAIKDAEKQVRGIFKDEYAKKAAADVNALARRLLAQSGEAGIEAPVRYVMLRDARDFGMQTGDLETAFKAIDVLGASFEFDRLAAKMALLTKATASAKSAETALPVALGYAQVMEECIAAGLFDAGAALSARGDATAKLSADALLQARVQAAGKELAYLQKEGAAVKNARKILEEKPTDPAANAAVGRFVCVSQGQWDKGLQMVVLGNEVPLKSAAEIELAGPADAKAQAALGDIWWVLADKERAPEARRRIQAHAASWYEKSLAGLTGLAVAGVEAKLRLTNCIVFNPAHQRRRTDLIGGSGGGPFEDTAPSPAPLIGLKASFLGTPSILKSIQAIYLVNGARVEGKVFGDTNPPVKEATAKPGYAVGGIISGGAEGAARGKAFKVVFMRIAGTGLDTADTYQSPWLGEKGGGEVKLGGDGSYVVGIQGRSASDIDAFGLIPFGR